ncbi:MAG: rhomboid family intramembrane serine protease [Chitinispirillaceae bacterium]
MNSFGSAAPRAIKGLVIANGILFVLQLIPTVGNYVTYFGSLIPELTFPGLQLWRTFTYMFLHDSNGIFHILFNMLVLWMFGAEMENLWGTKKFLIFYFICGVGAAFFSLFSLITAPFVPVIGASGAVLGVLTAYAYYYPHRQVLLFFVLPVNVRLLVIGYAVVSVLFSFQPGGVVSHLTHLGGIVVAFAYLKLYSKFEIRFQRLWYSWEERKRREEVSREVQSKKHFEQNIDPILDKIAKEGMESLSPREKKMLKQASRSNKERMKKRGILPFNLFK